MTSVMNHDEIVGRARVTCHVPRRVRIVRTRSTPLGPGEHTCGAVCATEKPAHNMRTRVHTTCGIRSEPTPRCQGAASIEF